MRKFFLRFFSSLVDPPRRSPCSYFSLPAWILSSFSARLFRLRAPLPSRSPASVCPRILTPSSSSLLESSSSLRGSNLSPARRRLAMRRGSRLAASSRCTSLAMRVKSSVEKMRVEETSRRMESRSSVVSLVKEGVGSPSPVPMGTSVGHFSSSTSAAALRGISSSSISSSAFSSSSSSSFSISAQPSSSSSPSASPSISSHSSFSPSLSSSSSPFSAAIFFFLFVLPEQIATSHSSSSLDLSELGRSLPRPRKGASHQSPIASSQQSRCHGPDEVEKRFPGDHDAPVAMLRVSAQILHEGGHVHVHRRCVSLLRRERGVPVLLRQDGMTAGHDAAEGVEAHGHGLPAAALGDEVGGDRP
mmetsp:Transcript_33175/g.76536  ORF Transcript_33175/g.76536 Transcript_33175/m.76536 type:complete len:360 (-) Transcript_33175:830-1909(-)